ncbi:hypothetical protein [Bosea minatitlanensis]|uniref:Uncharacterized protein n=1 Tax=Bosea minatitlanensis TaxID=128782 RepID=A0ABW0F340_9HYPH|nr:hypothetical protein [Bosea minatitlanensis]MCT4492709.1 hypothetical protein [Bosea minatitlanensis]
MIKREWAGETAVIIAGGPSLTVEDAVYCQGRARAVVVNDGYRIAPFADLLYAGDAAWWDGHQGAPSFAGQKWTQSKVAALRWSLRHIQSQHAYGISDSPERIHSGQNSGFQALNLTYLLGARRILLLGFDMQPTGGSRHWFGNHPPELHRDSNYAAWRGWFDIAAKQLVCRGVEVVNCSRETALTVFPRSTIQACL